MGKVQINIGSADYNLFLNVLKGAGGRWASINDGSFQPTYLDDKGYPTDVPAGGLCITVRIPPFGMSGRYYHLYWDGNGTTGSSANGFVGSYSVSGVQLDLGTSNAERSLQVKVLAVGTPGVEGRIVADIQRAVRVRDSRHQLRHGQS